MSLVAIPPVCHANNRKRKAVEWLRGAAAIDERSVKHQKLDGKTMKRMFAMALAKLKLKRLSAPDGSSNSAALRCITKDLTPIPSRSEIDRLRRQNTNRLMLDNKLILILDLDNTLLHTVDYKTLTLNEERSLQVDRKDIFEWGGDSVNTRQIGRAKASTRNILKRVDTNTERKRVTKLRPYVRTFLKEASKMYDMYIYTMGSRAYALQMAKFLDPEGVYFTSKVISREDCTRRKKKGLDVVLGEKRVAVIIDDKERVWKKHRKNLLVIDKYFFTGPEKKYFDIALMIKLHTLMNIHQVFFGSPTDKMDVRNVMQGMICSR